MKRYNNIFLAALFGATLLLGGCREEEKIADDLYIPGLGGEKYAENELDKWLYQNYTLPYNIDVVYRWDAAQAYSSLSEVQLVPVEFDAVQPMMAALRDVWFEPYIQATGNSQDFLKEVAPKKIVLVGSPEYQNGSYKLGQAEGGRKILLLNVNNFDASVSAISRIRFFVPFAEKQPYFTAAGSSTRPSSSTRNIRRSRRAGTTPTGRCSTIPRPVVWDSSPATRC